MSFCVSQCVCVCVSVCVCACVCLCVCVKRLEMAVGYTNFAVSLFQGGKWTLLTGLEI